jgi:hypothetical protein
MAYTLTNADFTPFDDVVVKTDQIQVNTGTPVTAQSGNDRVSGTYTSTTASGSGIELRNGTSVTNASLRGSLGNDLFEGTSTITSTAGSASGATAYGVRIRDYATLDTGWDNDVVRGRAIGSAITNARGISMNIGARLLTDWGNDTVIGEASGLTSAAQTGIEMVDDTTIDTSSGNDLIIGRADALLGTSGTIFGIRGSDSSQILTGSGNDVVIATATLDGVRQNGFGQNFSVGPMTIDLGSDNDVVRGFGNVKLKGGSGFDVYDLRDYKFSEFTAITKGSPLTSEVSFSIGAVTASTTGFEVFQFQDIVLPYQFLPVV